jgi:hypothetical protein
MPRFVCYFVDREDHIDDVVYLDARSLALAVYKGLALLAPHPDHSIEIWLGEETLFRSYRKDAVVRKPHPHMIAASRPIAEKGARQG